MSSFRRLAPWITSFFNQDHCNQEGELMMLLRIDRWALAALAWVDEGFTNRLDWQRNR